jgi:hypothetical protein
MTEQTTPLRQRMIEDMTIRNMFHGRSPDKLSFEDVRDSSGQHVEHSRRR